MPGTWIGLLLTGLCVGQSPEFLSQPSPEYPAIAVERAASDPVAQDEGKSETERWYFGTDYVLWWLREGRLPATLTTGPAGSQAVLGQPDTRVLYGDDRLETRHGDRFNGIRFKAGYWVDDEHTLGIEADAFFLERDSTFFKAISDGSTVLARPYTLPDGTAASAIIAGEAQTGERSGAFVGYSRVEIYGQQVNAVAPLASGSTFHVEVLGGVHFLQLSDRTDFTSSGQSIPDGTTVYGLEDHYRAANAYYGAQMGLRLGANLGRFFIEAHGEYGLGANDEQVRAFGTTITQTASERVAVPVGLLVQPSNSGVFDRTALNTVGEVGMNAGIQLSNNLRFSAGYTALFWDGVIRSGDQVETIANPNAATPPSRPVIPFKSDLFWAQGLNAGVQISW